MAGFAKTGVVLSSVTGCLVFQSAVVLRALICLAVTGDRLQFSLHDLTEAVLVTASFHIRLFITCIEGVDNIPQYSS